MQPDERQMHITEPKFSKYLKHERYKNQVWEFYTKYYFGISLLLIIQHDETDLDSIITILATIDDEGKTIGVEVGMQNNGAVFYFESREEESIATIVEQTIEVFVAHYRKYDDSLKMQEIVDDIERMRSMGML